MMEPMDAPAEPPDLREDSRPLGRRAFLGIVGLGLSSLVWGQPLLRALNGAESVLPASVRSAVPSLGGGWRIYSVNPPYPTYDAATWKLRIDGLVEHPQELTLAELKALPRAQQVSDFHCVTGWSVPDVGWAGVRFADLLAAAKPLPRATAIEFVSAEEPYVDTLTLDQAHRPDAMLAYEMDGKPITREHGAPVRAVMPQMYGYKSTKWVARLRLVAAPSDGYWEQRGYDRDAWVGKSNGY
jgi:DMSO/TMAO reductase YedYZ molybdopterin-dependent catalytic subunit